MVRNGEVFCVSDKYKTFMILNLKKTGSKNADKTNGSQERGTRDKARSFRSEDVKDDGPYGFRCGAFALKCPDRRRCGSASHAPVPERHHRLHRQGEKSTSTE
jgi:hypothetical protein